MTIELDQEIIELNQDRLAGFRAALEKRLRALGVPADAGTVSDVLNMALTVAQGCLHGSCRAAADEAWLPMLNETARYWYAVGVLRVLGMLDRSAAVAVDENQRAELVTALASGGGAAEFQLDIPAALMVCGDDGVVVPNPAHAVDLPAAAAVPVADRERGKRALERDRLDVH